jgi:hypothetical protein
MKRISLIALMGALLLLSVGAKEGMWMPLLIEKLNYDDLKANGFKLSAEDIYSVNQACLKDAVVIFGGGCTAELVSEEGLILTNHHCGFGEIQKHSSVKHNYVKEGFWAKKRSEELPNDDLSVHFLKEIIEFTPKILSGVPSGLEMVQEREFINNRIDSLEQVISDSLNLQASIENFFGGNEFYLFLYREFTDVRLVGAPPEAIGNFGGDTDNWVWPRHTGDFSIFRIYTSPDGEPADYAIENIPYKAKRFLQISAKGVNENDFTMVLGYPGSTQEYLYSAELSLFNDKVYPMSIKLRTGRLDIIDNARKNDEKIYIQYATKKQRISNAWKKWKGVLYGFDRFKAIEKRKDYEMWLLENAGEYKLQLQELYESFDDVYLGYAPYLFSQRYYHENLLQIEPLKFFYTNLIHLGADRSKEDIDAFYKSAEDYFKDYNAELDMELNQFLFAEVYKSMSDEYIPDVLLENQHPKKFNKYIKQLYTKSVFTNKDRFNQAFEKFTNGNTAVFLNDPVAILYKQVADLYHGDINEGYVYYKAQLENLYKEYIPLIQAIDDTRPIYPDANFTMRMTYGKVEGYSPQDATTYYPQTYLDGVIEKSHIGYHDYVVPSKLLELFESGDFGKYANEDGKMPVCFIASNHTSGGNSGSPVLDAEGRLIGINFDRTWEGTMSDYNFDEEICRNISVDIRYVLFIIDKFAGSGYLLDEMDIVW